MNKLRLHHMRSKILKYIRQIDTSGKIRRVIRPLQKQTPPHPEELLNSAEPIDFAWPPQIKKPFVGLVQERFHLYSSWPKFERFLKHNKIPYAYYDVHNSNFITQAKQFDLILWHTLSSFADQYEAKSKIEFIENTLNISCFPSCESLWFYEDKIRQQWLLEKNSIRAINSFISFSKEETIDFLKNCNYPIVSKEATNSGSEGVFLLKNYTQALKFVNQVFGPGHKIHSSTYLRQKDYVLFQELVQNDGYDLRVSVIDNNYFGYYREPPPGDFRASGAGNVIKTRIPDDALQFAKSIKEKLPYTPYLSIDMLRSSQDGILYVIEVSIFNRIRTSQQTIVDGTPGKYIFENGEFTFTPCQVWVQELLLNDLFNKWIIEHG
jgi:glutathione synthase/RimK-type ligase-like ATP-grasp enzyme